MRVLLLKKLEVQLLFPPIQLEVEHARLFLQLLYNIQGFLGAYPGLRGGLRPQCFCA